VGQTVSILQMTVWRSGALEGTKPDEAFFVRCDRRTMNQDDIDNGRLFGIIGIAPVDRSGSWSSEPSRRRSKAEGGVATA